MRQNTVTDLQSAIDYTFEDPALLQNALVHASSSVRQYADHNERLEFLGDAVLELLISDYLYRVSPPLKEGDMTRIRASVVCEKALFDVARGISLGECLEIGKGEECTGGRQKPSILSDALEAVFGAVYLDGGMDAARGVVLGLMRDMLDKCLSGQQTRDYKTILQEQLQKSGSVELSYQTDEAGGQNHNKTFKSTVFLFGEPQGNGTGKNKKAAEQQAAYDALHKMHYFRA